uniref:Uncharacterized protein n=1 Tax=Strigamia maritima TaxID=126957 RepID=T1JG03_STRMM
MIRFNDQVELQVLDDEDQQSNSTDKTLQERPKFKPRRSDDLPRKAKLIIFIVALILLCMCLILVGVTLKMAPLIDDMGDRFCEKFPSEEKQLMKFVKWKAVVNGEIRVVMDSSCINQGT